MTEQFKTPEGEAIDLSTKDGVLRFCELMREGMVEAFTANGRFEHLGTSYFAWVLATHRMVRGQALRFTTGERLEMITPYPVEIPPRVMGLIPPNQQTSYFGKVIQEYARITRASGVLVMSEAWRLSGDAAVEHAEAKARPYGWVEKHAEREEVLMVSLQHKTFGVQQWYAVIRRDPTRLEPWEHMAPTGAEGRLFPEW
jgi:hypothetical protein